MYACLKERTRKPELHVYPHMCYSSSLNVVKCRKNWKAVLTYQVFILTCINFHSVIKVASVKYNLVSVFHFQLAL